MGSRIYRLLDFLLIFIALPLVFYFELLQVPKIAALLGVTLIAVMLLWWDESYELKHLFYKYSQADFLKSLLWKSGLVALSLIGLVFIVEPQSLFAFPKEQPLVWVLVLLLYPFLSALPQELLYREFFFNRYEKLFKKEWILVLMSALSFCFLHIVYDNIWAIILSLVGGFIFGRSYQKTRSLFWVSLEHAIYGILVFTIGMGNYFYEGF